MQTDNLRAICLVVSLSFHCTTRQTAHKFRLTAALGQKRNSTIFRRIFSSQGEIERKEFALVCLSIYLLLALVYVGVWKLSADKIDIKVLFLFKSVVGIVTAVLIIPSAMKRLRSLRLSPYIAWLFVIPPVLNIRTFAVLNIDISAVPFFLIIGVSVLAIVLFVVLLLWPKRTETSARE